MRESSQDSTLALESLLSAFPHQRDIEKLDRHASLKPAVVAFPQPDAAHTALADLRHQSVGAKALAGQPSPFRQSHALLEKPFLGQDTVFMKERLQLVHQKRA